MKAKFITHPLFADAVPLNVFHKEHDASFKAPAHDPSLLNKHILFRKSVFLKKTKKAVMNITADDRYKLYINGVFVTEGPAPSYPESYFYNELNVTDYLKEGENTVALHTYYQGLINRVWVSGDMRACMWAELYADGEPVLVSDESWKCTLHTGYTECGKFGYDTQFAECYDSSSPEEGFFLTDYDDSNWKNAAVFENADYTLTKQPTSQLEFHFIKPVNQILTENSMILDFGREAVGYFNASARGKKGDAVILRFGEELNADGSVRYNMRCNCNYEEKWLLSGRTDTLMQYDYKAFRYAEIIFPSKAEITDLGMTVRHYPFAQKAVYKTPNTDLQKVIALCRDTVKYGMQDGFVDCPTREKGAYMGDISIAGRSHAVLTGDCTMMKKAILQFCDTAKVCPGLLAVSSSSLMQEIADYSLQFAAQLLWVYKTDGDLEFLKMTEPYATAMYEYFRKYANESGLIENVTDKWNLVDWPANLRDGYSFPLTKPIGKGVHNVLNAFWYGSLTALDEIYVILGKSPITGYVETVKEAFTRTFYRPEKSLFADTPICENDHFSLHSNVLPLLFGLAPSDAAIESMTALIEEKTLASAGVYMAYFTLAALKRAGKHELCERLATDKKCWMRMLSEGATTTYEAWGKDEKWNTSLFHPWASAPCIIFAEGALPY